VRTIGPGFRLLVCGLSPEVDSARRDRLVPGRTMRTVGRRLLLRPSPKLTLRINGILARAQKLTGVRVHLPAFPSNHGHKDAQAQPATLL
jgi:hypothetical protein